MKFELSDLPYDYDALDGFIGAETMRIHHQKHHGGYVSKLDDALASDARREKSLGELVCCSEGKVFQLAAQIWNHDFYWQSIAPQSTSMRGTELASLIDQSFGSLDRCKELFQQAAASEFGSGWAWLVYCSPAVRTSEESALEVISTSDAGNPITEGKRPLLTLDVWEHAYYLDYQNDRGRYISDFLDAHVDWAFAADNLQLATR